VRLCFKKTHHKNGWPSGSSDKNTFLKKQKRILYISQVPLAHSYNPSYPGGTDQEDYGLKPVWANNSWDSISEVPITKKGWWSGSSNRVAVWQAWGPEFKLQYCQKKKKEREKKKEICTYCKEQLFEIWIGEVCDFVIIFEPWLKSYTTEAIGLYVSMSVIQKDCDLWLCKRSYLYRLSINYIIMFLS
jgi:hypothetical protein